MIAIAPSQRGPNGWYLILPPDDPPFAVKLNRAGGITDWVGVDDCEGHIEAGDDRAGIARVVLDPAGPITPASIEEVEAVFEAWGGVSDPTKTGVERIVGVEG